MIKRILSSKTKLGIAIIIILMLVMGLSYGTFLIGTDNYKVSELLIAELNYGIKIEADTNQVCTVSETKVTTPANNECFVTIEISSVNPIDSRYALAYKNETGSATVQYTDKTQWKSEGVIEDYNRNYTRKVRVVINNTGQNTETITDFKVFGGYKFNSEVSIDLNNGYVTIPGTYTESVEAGNQRLVDIIEKDTNCLTSTSKECLYGGGVITNYLQYPTSSNASDNLWRITGSYELDGTTYAKVIYNTNQATTASANITNALDSFYKTLDKPDEVIQDTNKFNCTKDSCTQSDYSKIGLLSVYEYEQAGGYESYLGNESNWFALDSGTIKNITPNNIEEATSESGIRPTAYLQTDVTVTGKGTLEDPYRISPKGDINLAYTFNGKYTSETYKTLLKEKIVNKITCNNGTQAEWNYVEYSMKFSKINIPDSCTIDFVDAPKFMSKILQDNSTIYKKIDFSQNCSSSDTQPSGLYVESDTKYLEEDGKDNNINVVYYFSGNPDNNWVVFGGYWWRIIRTNEDGSVRLLYAGQATYDGNVEKFKGSDTSTGYIANSLGYTSSSINDFGKEYVGYMYGASGTLESNRYNTKSSQVKLKIDDWYDKNLATNKDNNNYNYGQYLSRTAVYCNDRSTPSYSPSDKMTRFAGYKRLVDSKRPSFKCGVNENGSPYQSDREKSRADRFTAVNNSNVGNQALEDRPIALITADEIAYAGGTYYNNDSNCGNTYYFKNSVGESVTGTYGWWTMTPFMSRSLGPIIFYTDSSGTPGSLNGGYTHYGYTVRPVLSLKSCVGVTGKGTLEDPYIPSIDADCAAADN